MSDWIILILAIGIAGWATWPPRGEQRRWLALGLAGLWAALVAVGVRRGVMPGFFPWLVVLALVGALVALLVVWSVTNLWDARRGRQP